MNQKEVLDRAQYLYDHMDEDDVWPPDELPEDCFDYWDYDEEEEYFKR